MFETKSQIKIILHPVIYLLPKKRIKKYNITNRTQIDFQWLFFTVNISLIKK